MIVRWTSEGKNLHFASSFGPGLITYFTVEALADGRWDWHVWDQTGWLKPTYGLSETAKDAKAQAELAFTTCLKSRVEV